MEANIKIAKPTKEDLEKYRDLQGGRSDLYCTVVFRRLTSENDFDQVQQQVAKAKEMFKIEKGRTVQ